MKTSFELGLPWIANLQRTMMRDLSRPACSLYSSKNRTINTVANKGVGQILGRQFRAAILTAEFRTLIGDVKLVFAKNTVRKIPSLSILEASDSSSGFQVYGAHVLLQSRNNKREQ